MMRKALAFHLCLAALPASASCDKLSPADAAVLSKQQLSNRYCVAKMGEANAAKLLTGMNERGISAENPLRLQTMTISRQCAAAAMNIDELYREKYRSAPPKPDLTKDCPGAGK